MAAMLKLAWRRLWARPLAWCLAAVVLAGMALELLLALGPFLAGQSRLLGADSAYGYTEYVVLPWLAMLVFALVLAATLLGMAGPADERRHGTLPVLLSCGLSPARIVLASWLALCGWLLLMLLLVLAMPLALALAGPPDWGKLASTALGLGLLSMTLAAIATACSAATRHPVLAGAATLVVVATLFFVARPDWQVGVLRGAAQWLALPAHLQPFSIGLVDTADVAWFLIISGLALALGTLRLDATRERD